MKAFFHRLIRELRVAMSGYISFVGEVEEGLRAFTRRHPHWKMFVLGCLLFPPFLAIGAGMVLMGLLTRLSDDTQR